MNNIYKEGLGEINLGKDYQKIKLLVIDIDGTMTDAGIYYDERGNELKRFSAKDAAGFFAAHAVGIEILVLTGRKSSLVERRMDDLKADYVIQGIRDKHTFLQNFIREKNLEKEQIGYIGDDLNDLKAMQLAEFVGCPMDACEEIIEIADYISVFKGGEGAVRDTICYLLKQRNEWQYAVNKVYDAGI